MKVAGRRSANALARNCFYEGRIRPRDETLAVVGGRGGRGEDGGVVMSLCVLGNAGMHMKYVSRPRGRECAVGKVFAQRLRLVLQTGQGALGPGYDVIEERLVDQWGVLLVIADLCGWRLGICGLSYGRLHTKHNDMDICDDSPPPEKQTYVNHRKTIHSGSLEIVSTFSLQNSRTFRKNIFAGKVYRPI